MTPNCFAANPLDGKKSSLRAIVIWMAILFFKRNKFGSDSNSKDKISDDCKSFGNVFSILADHKIRPF
jgi:hypothetical protein